VGRAAVVIAIALCAGGAFFLARPRVPRPNRPGPSRLQRGVALGLFASDPDWDYRGMVGEIAALGASDVEIAIAWDQGPLGSTRIEPRSGLSPSKESLRKTLRAAHAAGLRVLLFPIVHVAAARPQDWRGRIRFDSEAARDAWWTSYGAFVAEMASVAEQEHVARLSVGSELNALESDRARWAALIARIRERYHGRLVYSANWDHFDAVPFWDLVDEAGVTAYFELTRAPSPDLETLTAAWRARLPALADFAARVHRPLVLTEVGYPSLAGAHLRPWQEPGDAPPDAVIDLEEQRLCYAAFCATAGRAPFLDGIYVWNWFGIGGANDAGYTPRGKPAAEVLRAWLGSESLPASR
jgi:hypothetical protein